MPLTWPDWVLFRLPDMSPGLQCGYRGCEGLRLSMMSSKSGALCQGR